MQSASNQHSADPINPVVSQVNDALPNHVISLQTTVDGMPTLWVDRAHIKAVLKFLRDKSQPRFEMLLDVTGIDERVRVHRTGQPASEFTVVYHLTSFSGHCDIRVKVPLMDADPKAAYRHRSLAERQLVRARNLGHVWY